MVRGISNACRRKRGPEEERRGRGLDALAFLFSDRSHLSVLRFEPDFNPTCSLYSTACINPAENNCVTGFQFCGLGIARLCQCIPRLIQERRNSSKVLVVSWYPNSVPQEGQIRKSAAGN